MPIERTVSLVCCEFGSKHYLQIHTNMLTLLKSLVIPLPEYCCQHCNPWKTKDIHAIEAFNERIHTK